MQSSSKKTIALLFGGRGYEREVSVKSAEYVFEHIDKKRYEPLPVYINPKGEWLIPTNKDLHTPSSLVLQNIKAVRAAPIRIGNTGHLISESGDLTPIYCALPILHGDGGEDGTVQGALECAAVSYVGCNTLASALAIDKSHTKTVAQHLGIPTAKWVCARRGDTESAGRLIEADLHYPLFVKPAHLGSSIGAARVLSEEDFAEAFLAASKLDNKVIIEELVDIEVELECAYFATKSKELFTNIGEIRCLGAFYDYDEKYKSTEKTLVTSHSLHEGEYGDKIREYSKLLVDLIGIRHIARIDFFLSKCGKLFFNEINTIPGFTSGSLYPSLLKSEGLDITDAVSALIEDAAEK